MTPEQRIEKLGLVLPEAAGTVANYVPWAISGNVVPSFTTVELKIGSANAPLALSITRENS